MSLFKTILAYVQLFAFIGYGVRMKHAIFNLLNGQYLPDSVITTKYTKRKLECSMHCTSIDASCLSVNYKASGVDQGVVCQLNNNTTLERLGLVSDDRFVYLSIVKRVRYFFMISQMGPAIMYVIFSNTNVGCTCGSCPRYIGLPAWRGLANHAEKLFFNHASRYEKLKAVNLWIQSDAFPSHFSHL
jgi:hypothetical protein